MTGRDRQVAAYRRSEAGAIKIKARGRAVARAATWVREEHPQVWERLLAEATVEAIAERDKARNRNR